jgi:hypothetical protein
VQQKLKWAKNLFWQNKAKASCAERSQNAFWQDKAKHAFADK